MAASDRRGQEEDGIKRFDPRILDRSVIAIPLLEAISKDENRVHAVIIDVNLDYDEGREAGRKWIREAIKNAIAIIAPSDEKQGVREKKSDLSNQYIFARLSGKVIRELVRLDVEHAGTQAKTAKNRASRRNAEKPQCSRIQRHCTVFVPSTVSGPISRFHPALRSRSRQ
jgi:hypothetical protein